MPQVLANGDEPIPLTFDFTDRIPINAMDLYLQVVYRGKLGDEPDALVVGTKDISEPTFIKITDYRTMHDFGTCQFSDLPDPTSYRSAFNIALTSDVSVPFLVKADINATQYSMFAVISDPGRINARVQAIINKFDPTIVLPLYADSYNINGVGQIEVNDGVQPNSNLEPEYRLSQFNATGPNQITLSNTPPPTNKLIRGTYIDYGIFVGVLADAKKCNFVYPITFTEFHEKYPPHVPLLPTPLTDVKF